MSRRIRRSGSCENEWHVYCPSYAGAIHLHKGLYWSAPRVRGKRPWPMTAFSEIGLAADYIVEAVADPVS